MHLKKALALSALLCTLCLSAYAEVRTIPLEEKCASGTFKVAVPKPMLQKSLARQQATANIQAAIDKFRYQAEKIGNTEVTFTVTSDNDSYVSIIMEGIAFMPGLAHPEKETHAIVLDKATGELLPLSNFVKIPTVQFLKDQAAAGNLELLASDGHTELPIDTINSISEIPQEFIVDKLGNVYLLASEITVYATGTPLIALPIKNLSSAYVVKG